MTALDLEGGRIDEFRLGVYAATMKPSHQKILDQVLRLPAEARAALAGRLLESLDGPVDAAAEAAWSKEIGRRIEDLDQGRVKTVSWGAARRQIVGRSRGTSKR